MSHSKIPLWKWATAFYLHVSDPKGINARQLSRKLKLNYRSAWFLLHRIREAWPDPEPLRSRIAEIDEAYFGGDDKKKHRNKKFHWKWRYGNTAVAGMVDRETGLVAAKVILNADREILFPFAEEHLSPLGVLSNCYSAIQVRMCIFYSELLSFAASPAARSPDFRKKGSDECDSLSGSFSGAAESGPLSKPGA